MEFNGLRLRRERVPMHQPTIAPQGKGLQPSIVSLGSTIENGFTEHPGGVLGI